MSSTSQTKLWAPCLSMGKAWNAPIRLVWRWRLFRVVAQPGKGAVQQLCRRPAQSQGHALRQGVGSLPLPAWNRHQHCCCRQGEALRQQLNQGRKRFALALLTQLQQQLAQIACVRPESAPRQGQQALEPLTRESKGIEARGAGSRRRQRTVPRSITDRAAGLYQQSLGKAQERTIHSRWVAATSVHLLG